VASEDGPDMTVPIGVPGPTWASVGVGFINRALTALAVGSHITLGQGADAVPIDAVSVSVPRPGSLVVDGRVAELAASATVNVASEWDGDDLRLSGLAVRSVNCGALGGEACAALSLKYRLASSVLFLRFQGTPLRPEGVYAILPFRFGGVVLKGQSTLTQLRAAADSVVILGDLTLERVP
jgi:hypothetical protein